MKRWKTRIAALAAKAEGGSDGEAGEPVGVGQKIAAEVEGWSPPEAVLEDDRQQLGIGEGLGTVSEEALTGAFVAGDLGDLAGGASALAG